MNCPCGGQTTLSTTTRADGSRRDRDKCNACGRERVVIYDKKGNIISQRG